MPATSPRILSLPWDRTLLQCSFLTSTAKIPFWFLGFLPATSKCLYIASDSLFPLSVFSAFYLPAPIYSCFSVLAFQCVVQHLLQVLKTQDGHWMFPSDLSYLTAQHISPSHLQTELKDCSCTTACRRPPTLQGLALAHLFLSWVG